MIAALTLKLPEKFASLKYAHGCHLHKKRLTKILKIRFFDHHPITSK